MTTTFKPLYGTTNQAITITLNSLASSATAGRQSAVVDNRTTLYRDALVGGKFQIPTGGSIGNDKCIYLYVFATSNDSDFGAERGVAGTQATLGAGDAAYSMTDPSVAGSPAIINARRVAVPVAPTSTAGIYVFAPFSIANLFGTMPAQWGVVVRNYCGIGLDSAGNSMWYQGINDQA